MSKYFSVSVTFLDGQFHGKVEDGLPEWPPSPLRLFQAIVNANAFHVGDEAVQESLLWLEQQPPPLIVAPPPEVGTGYVLSVPNNAMDLVARAWCRGNYFGTGDANPATHRTMKRVRPVRIPERAQVHYLWELPESDTQLQATLGRLTHLAKRVFRLGWGPDLVATNARIMTAAESADLQGECWKPGTATGRTVLRVPRRGTLSELCQRHGAFLERVTTARFAPVDPPTQFTNIGYRRSSDAVARPHVVFELRTDDGDFFAYPQRKLIHIAGMVRHVAIETMKHSPPPEVETPAEWIDQYIAGHVRTGDAPHRQLSYLPLPSIGHPYADQAVRRIMIAAPVGDERLLEHVARHIAGQRLVPENGAEFAGLSSPTLVRIYRDKVASYYTRLARTWASVTPVVLPGHDDRKPSKTARLVQKALRQSGIEQPCTFEWRSVSWWPKSLTAHKYDREGNPSGYLLPKYLETLSLVHLKIDFSDDLHVPGPIAIGAGRHCGLGLLAAMEIS